MGTARLAAIGAVVAAFLAPPAFAHDAWPIELEGTLRVRHSDDFAKGKADFHYSLETASGPVELGLTGGDSVKLAGKKVKLRGKFEDGIFVPAGGAAEAAQGEATVAAVTGTKQVAVVMFNFSNNTSQPWTYSFARGVVFDNADSVNAYYQDASYGQMSMAGDVFGWYTIPDNDAGCRYTTWASLARQKASEAGVNLSVYQYVVFAFPSISSCGWAGLAYLPGSESWINGAMNLRVVAHELGHNFGVHHASTQSCTSGGVRVTLSSTCTLDEYGDPFTVMGSSSSRLHLNWHRSQMGWLGDVQTVSASGTYMLAPVELSGSARLLRIARSDGTYFQLEFRQPWGLFDSFGAGDAAVNGVTIRIAPDTNQLVQSKLLDATPATTTFTDAPLALGQTFADPFSGLQITTAGVSAAGAQVTVQFVPDAQAPTTPGSLSAQGQSTSSIRLTWTASSDNVGVSGYRIYRGGTEVATTTATTWTESGLAPSTTYAYDVVAYDAAQNASVPASATGSTLDLDLTPPSAPGGFTASVKSGRRVALAWSASTDNVAVASYRIFRNGVQIAQITSRSYTDKPGRGTFTYYVIAVDTSSNSSGPSVSKTVKV